MKKMITFATAASLLMGSMVMPAYGAAFADIDTVTWSGFKPFLEEAAELGLMKGYDENGKMYCKPRNNVTYCEAVQLMYSIMKVYRGQDVSDATVTKWKPVMSAYNIPEWAYKATAYSLDNSILQTSDLDNLQANQKGINEKRASREAVGVIFGKALDTVSGYDTKSGAALSYKDKGQISASAVPYLELLNRTNLMVGDTDNNFSPKANITRAEMAVLSVKTYKKLTETGTPVTAGKTTAAGTVTTSMVMQNGDLFVTVKTSTGATLSLFGVKGDVTAKYDGEKIGFDEIGQGDTVKVTYEGTNLTSIEVTYSKAGLDEKTTKVTYELEELSGTWITVLDGSKEKEFRLDDDVDVELDGKNSTVKKLQSAMEEANYDVTLTLDADEYVLEIEAKMNSNNPTEGTVEDVSDDSITIKAGSREYTYPLAEDLEIEQDGKTVRFSRFEDDYKDYNYIVSLKLNDDHEVEEIEIESMEDEYNGTLTFINSSRIEIEAGGKKHEYDLDEDVDVEIEGKKSSVSDLRKGYLDDKNYRVSLELNRSDDVIEIIATTKFGSNNDGELKDIDDNEITIVAKDKEYTYDLAREVDVKINGKNRDLEDLENNLGNYRFTIKLGFDTSGDVSEISATLLEVNEGELRNLIPEQNYLQVVAAELNVDLDLANNVDVTLNGDKITLDELNGEIDYAFGDSRIYVELEYNSSGKVNEIEAYWEDVSGELKSVDEEEDEIKVGSKTYALARSTDFIYKLSTSVDEKDYRDVDDYDEDLDGLEKFLDDCDEANDTCMVSLTLNSSGDVTRIKATAK